MHQNYWFGKMGIFQMQLLSLLTPSFLKRVCWFSITPKLLGLVCSSKKPTGAQIEIFCLDPIEPADYQISFQQTQSCIWNCMVGNLKKWKEEPLLKKIEFEGETVNIKAEKLKTRRWQCTGAF